MIFKHDLVSLPELKTIQTEQGRFYVSDDGGKYPSVTTVLGRRKEKREALKAWRQRVGNEEANRISGRAARRGTAVHKLVERYVLNEEIDLRKEMPLNAEMFKSIQPVLLDSIKLVRAVEVPLFSHKLRLAGRTDLIGCWDNVNAVIDIKSSTRIKQEEDILDYFLQCTAYAIMFEELTGILTPNIVVVIANEDAAPSVFEKSRSDYEQLLYDFLEQYNK